MAAPVFFSHEAWFTTWRRPEPEKRDDAIETQSDHNNSSAGQNSDCRQRCLPQERSHGTQVRPLLLLEFCFEAWSILVSGRLVRM